MKIVFLICLMLFAGNILGQNFITPKGEYMDTTRTVSSNCAPPYVIFYYNLKGKYPVSSSAILRESREYLKQKGHTYSGDGYITFRFFIDCEGIMSRIQVLQTDDNYKSTHFQKEFADDLYSYLKTMKEWKKNLEIQTLKNANYIAFISFKIKNGEVVNIIP
ncbi:MAG: hypothetical protein ABIN24_01595 [Dyadobacter sp.]|uniref:hypothetical protein n=1 Tax=Dyadobacter sp. 3J3 TaxID=2606600 RepID=UPI001356EDB9|nr:hypothetical protein [Dyadobacter sp. 3J3]